MLCGDKQIVLWYFLKWPIKIAKQCPSIPPKVCGFCFDTFLLDIDAKQARQLWILTRQKKKRERKGIRKKSPHFVNLNERGVITLREEMLLLYCNSF